MCALTEVVIKQLETTLHKSVVNITRTNLKDPQKARFILMQLLIQDRLDSIETMLFNLVKYLPGLLDNTEDGSETISEDTLLDFVLTILEERNI